MKLSDLVKTVEPLCVACTGADKDSDLQITSVHYRSQEVQPGGLFVAIAGLSVDGHDFIEDAVSRGAAAIVSQKPMNSATPNVRVTDSRQALADIAARFYDNPSAHLTVIGITGTNGKTTTAYLVESILQQAGLAVGVIGTINYRYAGSTFDNPITTPESLDLQRMLSDMLRSGISHVVMEVSSHAIDLQRIRGCWFDVAVFINLSQDHLDFHGDMQSYWLSKQRLFTDYLVAGPKRAQAVAVINCHNASGQELAQKVTVPVLTTGLGPDETVRVQSAHCKRNRIDGEMITPAGQFHFKSRLVGEHNLENILCAAGVAAALNLSNADVKSGIEAVATIPGRLESIDNTAERYVYVDYAHTPDALENVIMALKAVIKDRLICVFGCGGDRDKDKRPLMGEIAARLCDLAIITSDNPRTEDPMAIINHIIEGALKAKGRQFQPADLGNGFKQKGFTVEADRKQAIRLGIAVSKPGDTVLIAGKGHETYQILGSTTIDFDDRHEARLALRAVSGQSSVVGGQ
ncbi:MAG: UDP-N-acetylmuramoyl-L-alanyl-D-glutamate--2,6-diaminopimelate ligase [Desulfobacterales bacterium]